ncbi:hypothetical protein QBC35DRAFT_388843 [Podospora australis]|uniref:Uncharacterized protein n=1 Tax=Podospora australis TaxID=1536484 RepID=A0AAN6WQR0_9PEZI|nr:hypothetical protein QBC35DRAFT_388843 [Podospora australis]
MGRSYDRGSGGGGDSKIPMQWTDEILHKYCGKVDRGREGKSNKAQKCDECILIKASREKAQQKDTSSRRNEKMGWQAGDLGWM